MTAQKSRQKFLLFKIKVEEILEDGKTYYLATSTNLRGLLVQGNTLDEVQQTVPHVIDDLLKAKKERMQRRKHKNIPIIKKAKKIEYNFAQEHLCPA